MKYAHATRNKTKSETNENRPAWVDPSTSLPLGYCSSACAEAHGAHHLVGRDQCSLPGCVSKTLLHNRTGANLGYCAEIHLHRAASRQLVSDGQALSSR